MAAGAPCRLPGSRTLCYAADMTHHPSRRDLVSRAALSLLAAPAVAAGAAEAEAGSGAAGQEGALSRPADAAALPFDPGWRGDVTRTVQGRLRDTVSILDFIPVAEHAAIKARTGTTDLAPYFGAAIAHMKAVGGGELYVPAGRYRCASSVTLCKFLHLRGAGKVASIIEFVHAGTSVASGSGLKLVQPSNSSTEAYVKISDLAVEMTHASNVGACFYDNCSTYLTLRDCSFVGGKFGVIFDQTEVSGIYSCNLAGQRTGGAGLWIVNGPDLTPGNQAGFTNQITVDHNCQFNQAAAYAVIDDGGDCHHFGNNNYNGGGLTFCGVGNLTVIGGEYESVNGHPTFTFGFQTHYSNNGVGACNVLMMNGLIVQPGRQPCIVVHSLYTLHMQRMSMTATGVAGCVSGTNNVGALFARGNVNPNTPVPIFDNYASGLHDDGYLPIRSFAGTTYTLTTAEANAVLQTTSRASVAITVPSNSSLPYSIGTRIVVEQNGTGAVSLHAAAGTTLHGTVATNAQYQMLTLIKTAANRWLVTRQT